MLRRVGRRRRHDQGWYDTRHPAIPPVRRTSTEYRHDEPGHMTQEHPSASGSSRHRVAGSKPGRAPLR